MKTSTRCAKSRTALGAAIVAACAIVTSLGIGVGVANVATAATPPTPSPGMAGPSATCPTGFVLTGGGTVCVRATAQDVTSADVIGCPVGWGNVPLPAVVDGVRQGQCAEGGPLSVMQGQGVAGYVHGTGPWPDWVRWAGTVSIPAGRHAVTLNGNPHAIAMIDNATLAPSHAHGVRGVRSVILTGPETVKARVDWSGLRRAWLTIKPWPGVRH